MTRPPGSAGGSILPVVRYVLPVARGPERRDQPCHQRGQENLPGECLHDGDGPAGIFQGRKVAVTQGGQRGEAEVLEGLGIARLVVREEVVTAEVVYRREEGREHQADDEICAERAEDV